MEFFIFIRFYTIKTKITYPIKKWSEVNWYIFLRWIILSGTFLSYLVYFDGKLNFWFLHKRFWQIKQKILLVWKNSRVQICRSFSDEQFFFENFLRIQHRFGAKWNFSFLLRFFTIKRKITCSIKKWSEVNWYIFLRWTILSWTFLSYLVYFVGKIEFLIFIKTFLTNKTKNMTLMKK